MKKDGKLYFFMRRGSKFSYNEKGWKIKGWKLVLGYVSFFENGLVKNEWCYYWKVKVFGGLL